MRFTEREKQLLIEALCKQARSFDRAATVDGGDQYTDELRETAKELRTLAARIENEIKTPSRR